MARNFHNLKFHSIGVLFCYVFLKVSLTLFLGLIFHNFNMCEDCIEAPLIAQLVKNLPAMQETPGQFLGWEDPLEKG